MYLISGVHHERTRSLYAGVCPGATANGESVQVYVAYNHPLLQLKRALPWEALCEVMTHHWRLVGKNTDGRPGLPWDVGLYVPLIVLMVVKASPRPCSEAYVAENAVARVFIGRQDDLRPQIRDHANIARAYAALGKDGVEEINALILHVARDYGFADVSLLSSDTTAQELPIGYPNEPGILRGLAQRCGRALAKLKTRAVVGVDTALAQVQTILRTVKEHHLFAKSKQVKRQVLTRLLTEVGALVVQTRLLVQGLGTRRDRVTQHAITTLTTMHAVAKRLIPQIVQWITTGVVAQGKIVHVGVTQALGTGAPQGGKRGGVWPAVSAESPRRWVCLWDLDPRWGGRVEDALAGAGGVPRHLWSARHTRVDGLRPRRLCPGHRQSARQRGRQGDWHSAQRPSGMARCRGRPRDRQKRAWQDRRHHWHPEDGQIWVQQPQGTSVADAGDGRSAVSPLVQSEQVDAGCGTSPQVKRKGLRANRIVQTAPIERQEGGQEAAHTPQRSFATRSS